MDSCEAVIEMLPEYINKSTTRKQNSFIARHIALCLLCRAEFVLWYSVGHVITQKATQPSAINYQALFAKLPQKETELNKIVNSGSFNMAFDLIRYALSTIKTTYRLAGLV